jgi:hypothetical protein
MSWPPARSSIGTMSGGSLTILGSPSMILVSLASARRLSFERALARFFSINLRRFALAAPRTCAIIASASTREYHRSRVFIDARARIPSR